MPRSLAEEAMSKERSHPSEASQSAPWPLDAWPGVQTKFVLCTEDRFVPPDFLRRLGRVSQFRGAHAGVNDCTGQ